MQSFHYIAYRKRSVVQLWCTSLLTVCLNSKYTVVDTVGPITLSCPGNGKNDCICGRGESSIWVLIKHNFLVGTITSRPEWFLIENIREEICVFTLIS